jgi:fibronectin type 3 domain-containing protein
VVAVDKDGLNATAQLNITVLDYNDNTPHPTMTGNTYMHLLVTETVLQKVFRGMGQKTSQYLV